VKLLGVDKLISL